MKDILKRLQSPVVITQVITIIGSLIVALMPELSEQVKSIVYGITVIVNIFAGLNNPTETEKF